MQAEYLDRFSRGSSLIHRMGPRWKIVATLAIVCLIAATPARWWAARVAEAALVLGIYAAARLPWTYLLRRLALPLPFLLLIAAGGPLSHGSAGGWGAAADILTRAVLSLVVVITLVATTPFPMLLDGLRSLGMPRVMLWILAFMYRYIFVLSDELQRMRRAILARSGRRRFWVEMRMTGRLAGMLFIRAFERAERVHAAMLARGWNGPISDDQAESLSFPGSAWERTEGTAPPCDWEATSAARRGGRASEAVRSQAEPGNEGIEPNASIHATAASAAQSSVAAEIETTAASP